MKYVGRLIQAAVVSSLLSCRPSPSPAPQPAAGGASPSPAQKPPPASHSPLSQAELPTTDPAISVENFLSLYRETAKRDAEHPKDSPPAIFLNLLGTHAQYFGALADYDRALEGAERLVAHASTMPEAYLARASARQSLHLFTEALDDLNKAEALKADKGDLASARAGIAQALGHYDDALAIRKARYEVRESMSNLSLLALATADVGQAQKADAMLVHCQDLFDDVSPFPLAWLYFQQGLLAERNGMEASARALYEAAHERLPIYAPATGHLAALVALKGDRARAISLLEPIAAVSDDPEYWGQLGALLIADGDVERGKALVDKAKHRYDELVAKHPAAFADHAARFWLGPGGDVGKARKLAARNFEARKNRDAYVLLIEAALAAHDNAAACGLSGKALEAPYPTAQLHLRASQAFRACGQTERADQELALASAVH